MAKRETRKNKFFRIIIIAIAVVTFWWGVWGLLDTFFHLNNPIIGYIIGIAIALLVLYFDDFRLKELE